LVQPARCNRLAGRTGRVRKGDVERDAGQTGRELDSARWEVDSVCASDSIKASRTSRWGSTRVFRVSPSSRVAGTETVPDTGCNSARQDSDGGPPPGPRRNETERINALCVDEVEDRCRSTSPGFA